MVVEMRASIRMDKHRTGVLFVTINQSVSHRLLISAMWAAICVRSVMVLASVFSA